MAGVRGRRWQREHGGGCGGGGPGPAERWRRRGRAPRGGGSLSGAGNLLPPRRCPVSGEGGHGRSPGGRWPGPGRAAGAAGLISGSGSPPPARPCRFFLAEVRPAGLSHLPPVSPQAWSPRCRRAGSRGDARGGAAGGKRLSLSEETFGVCETCTSPETLVSVLLLLLHLEE